MKPKFSRTAAALSLAAALSMAATPALANHRDWDGNWGGGWGRHHDRIDAGDIFAGVLILGSIAAIASAASKSNKAKRERERSGDYQYPRQSYPQQSYPRQSYPQDDDSAGYGNDNRPSYDETRGAARGESRGLDNAVNSCAKQIKQGDRRIEVIDAVTRDGEGWRVVGQITSGGKFTCMVDRDGRVQNVDSGDQTL